MTAAGRRLLMTRLLCALAAAACSLTAHEFTITPVTLVLTGDGRFQADVGLDADALALGLPLETDSAAVAAAMRQLTEERFEAAVMTAKTAARADVEVLFGPQRARTEVEFPHFGTAAASEAEPPTILGTVARLSGPIPQGSAQVSVRLPARYKTVSLQILAAGRSETYTAILEPGERSAEISLSGSDHSRHRQSVLLAYLELGFTHIVPKGLDHILFVLGLFLLSTRWRPLLLQVTAFTIAHSVTLALAMQGVVSLPSRLVETVIALSITWVAVENIATTRLRPWRVGLVFGFGLLHGLGFAGVLGELGMPEGDFLAALLSFNLGVELGQLAVVLAAFAATARFRNLRGYRRFVVIPSSALIALAGCWWAVTRAAG